MSLTGPDLYQFNHDLKFPVAAGPLDFMRTTLLAPGYWEVIAGSHHMVLGGNNSINAGGINQNQSDFVPKPFGSWHHDNNSSVTKFDALPDALVWHNLMSLVYATPEPGDPAQNDSYYFFAVYDTNNYLSLWASPDAGLTQPQYISKHKSGALVDSNYPGELWFSGFVDGGLKPDGGPAYVINPDGGTYFTLFREREGRYTYAGAYGTPYEQSYSLAPRRFYLTHIDPLQYGGAGIRISYAQPTNVTCPSGTDAGTPGVPYINEVSDDDGGARIRFVWKSVRTVDAGTVSGAGAPATECVIDHIDVLDNATSSWVPQVQYSYNGSGVDVGGWVAATQQVNVLQETYVWDSGVRYQRSIDGLTRTYGLNTSDLVTSALTPYENFTVTSNSTPSSSVVWTTGSGAIGGGTTSVTEAIGLVLMQDGWHGVVPGAQDAGCPGSPYSCSPGTITNVAGSHYLGIGDYMMATQAKNGFYSTYNEVSGSPSGLGFDEAPELQQQTWGGTDQYGTGALEVQNYTYTYGGWNQSPRFFEQLANTAYRASTSGSGSAVRAWVYEDGGVFTNRLKADIRTGSVLSSDGTTWTQTGIGTFYFTRQSLCDAGTPDDPYGRTLEVHGPCTVSSASATDCAGASFPVTQYAYYAGTPGTLGNRASRLASVTRFTNGNSCGTALTTSFDDYDALGHPTSITDQNNTSTTTFSYSVGGSASPLLRSMTVDTGAGHLNLTTNFSYDDGKLSKVQYPALNAEEFCYRTVGGVPSFPCPSGPTSQLTEKPVYSAKTDGNLSPAWSELVAYTYEPNTGMIASATFWQCAAGASCNSFPTAGAGFEKRRVEQYAFDAHRRPTWQGWGSGSGSFDIKRFFDRESDLAGVSLPSVGAAPAFCGGPLGSNPDLPTSKLCASLTNDAADRLTALTVYPDGSTPTTTCFAHDDAQGNVTAVLPGQGSTCPGAIGSNNGATRYTYDDFGRLAKVDASWAFSGSAPGSGRGQYVYIYDALGDVVQAFTPTLSAGSSTFFRGYSYDQLGRQLTATVNNPSTTTLYTLGYDAASPTFCSGWGSVNAYGRLAVRTDAAIPSTSYYQYDGAGRLTAETRPINCPAMGLKHSFTTSYAYDSNGNLTQTTYPLGLTTSAPPLQDSRTAGYNYGTGAYRDRPSSVSLTRRESGVWVNHVVIDTVQWEPYGGLRSYRVIPPDVGGAHFVVENLLGDDGTQAPAAGTCPVLPSAGSSDLTGRLRAIWVSAGDAGGVGDIYNRGFAWSGDEPTQITTCVLGSNTRITQQNYTYDNAGQLTNVDGGYSKTGTGGYAFSIDARGNRTQWVRNNNGNVLTTSYSYGSSGYVPDMLMAYGRQETLFDGGSASSGRKYTWDQDGRLLSEVFDAGTLGSSAYNYDYLQDAGSAYYGYQVGGAWYVANVDAFNRRAAKTYPSGYSDVYMYDLGHQMLEDQGLNSIAGAPANYVMDDYVWLGGRPVIVARGKLSTGYVWQDDTSTSCGRNDDPSPPNCGFYYPVTDHLGATVVVLDGAARVTATQDYDAFGYINRGQIAGQASVGSSTNYQFGNYGVPYWTSFTSQTRAKLSSGVMSSGSVLLKWGTATISTLSSSSTSPEWTPWGTVTTGKNSGVDLWYAPTTHTAPAIVAEAYEVRRWQTGANYFSIPLRFEGQYFDSETDHVENWNRYYDPQIGRYLGGDPLLLGDPQSMLEANPEIGPKFVQALATQGETANVYSYASNSPASRVDPDGRFGVVLPSDPECRAVCEEERARASRLKGIECSMTAWASWEGRYVAWDRGRIRMKTYGAICVCTGFTPDLLEMWFAVVRKPNFHPL